MLKSTVRTFQNEAIAKNLLAKTQKLSLVVQIISVLFFLAIVFFFADIGSIQII